MKADQLLNAIALGECLAQAVKTKKTTKAETLVVLIGNQVECLVLVVEYSTATNTHPEGVRLAVLKTAPEEEFGGYRRICANVLAG